MSDFVAYFLFNRLLHRVLKQWCEVIDQVVEFYRHDQESVTSVLYVKNKTLPRLLREGSSLANPLVCKQMELFRKSILQVPSVREAVHKLDLEWYVAPSSTAKCDFLNTLMVRKGLRMLADVEGRLGDEVRIDMDVPKEQWEAALAAAERHAKVGEGECPGADGANALAAAAEGGESSECELRELGNQYAEAVNRAMQRYGLQTYKAVRGHLCVYLSSLCWLAEIPDHIPAALLRTIQEVKTRVKQLGLRSETLDRETVTMLIREANAHYEKFSGTLQTQEMASVADFLQRMLLHEGTPAFEVAPSTLHVPIEKLRQHLKTSEGRDALGEQMKPLVQGVRSAIGEPLMQQAEQLGDVAADDTLGQKKQQELISNILSRIGDIFEQNQEAILDVLNRPETAFAHLQEYVQTHASDPLAQAVQRHLPGPGAAATTAPPAGSTGDLSFSSYQY